MRKGNNNDYGLEAFLADRVSRRLNALSESVDPVAVQYRKDAESAKSRVAALLHDPQPLDRVRSANSKAYELIKGLRTWSQWVAHEQLLLSELLCEFPLRREHWVDMRITRGPVIPDNPSHNSLHIYDHPQGNGKGRYALVAPVSAFKNGHSARQLRSLRPPRVVYDISVRLDPLIERHLNEVRPKLLESSPQHVKDNTAPDQLFTVNSASGLAGRMQAFQRQYLLPHLPLDRPWAFHSYRALVATHVIKNAKDDGVSTAASLLVDSKAMIEEFYGQYRPEDGFHKGRLATELPNGEDDFR